jgi:hypothetical protein
MIYHTVYLAYEEGPNGRNYIGKHSTGNPYDSYLGSCLDPSFSPVGKIILGVYKSARAAVEAEIQWQKSLSVVTDNSYANQAYQTATGYDTTGRWRPLEEVRPGGLAAGVLPWWNKDGECKRSWESPGEGWNPGRPEAFNGRRGDPSGTKWWVNRNGENKRSSTCPGTGWKEGRKWQES